MRFQNRTVQLMLDADTILTYKVLVHVGNHAAQSDVRRIGKLIKVTQYAGCAWGLREAVEGVTPTLLCFGDQAWRTVSYTYQSKPSCKSAAILAKVLYALGLLTAKQCDAVMANQKRLADEQYQADVQSNARDDVKSALATLGIDEVQAIVADVRQQQEAKILEQRVLEQRALNKRRKASKANKRKTQNGKSVGDDWMAFVRGGNHSVTITGFRSQGFVDVKMTLYGEPNTPLAITQVSMVLHDSELSDLPYPPAETGDDAAPDTKFALSA